MRKILRGRGEFEALQYDGNNLKEFEEVLGADTIYGWRGPYDTLKFNIGKYSEVRMNASDWLVWKYHSDGSIALMVAKDGDMATFFQREMVSQSED